MKIKFTGVVHPPSLQISLKRENAVVAYKDAPGTIRISYTVDKCAVTAEAEYDSEFLDGDFGDKGSLTGVIATSIQSELNLVNVVNGTSLSVDILEYNAGDGWHLPTPYIPAIRERENELTRDEKTARLYALMSSNSMVAQVYLTPIVSDLNLAIRYPIDTAFFCYRAVETMARFFCESMSSKKVAERHFSALFKHLNTSQDEFKLLTKYANSTRHGNVVPISSALRASLFDAAWNFFDAFIAFAEKDFSGVISSYEKDVQNSSK